MPLTLALFIAAAAVILIVGIRLAALADVLADRTGLGEAVFGGVLLGATTSASGAVTSITAAAMGDVNLAYSNAVGGIATQTAFLVVADIFHRRANLEHAAADVSNLSQATMLIVLLTVPLTAAVLPPVTLWGIHPASIILIALYFGGVVLARQAHDQPMWHPKKTRGTREDRPDEEPDDPTPTWRLSLKFLLLVLIICAAGFVVGRTGSAIAEQTGIASSVVGALMTATVTSLPELVTTVAAVRRGALQLAVGGIIGGNTFDVLFLSASDVAYRDGSIYNAIDAGAQFWIMVGIAMTGLLLLGMIRRQPHGVANIGFESAGLLLVYIGAVVAAAWLF